MPALSPQRACGSACGWIWFVTVLALVSYAVVLAAFVIQGHMADKAHRHFIFAVGLVVMGSVVSYRGSIASAAQPLLRAAGHCRDPRG